MVNINLEEVLQKITWDDIFRVEYSSDQGLYQEKHREVIRYVGRWQNFSRKNNPTSADIEKIKTKKEDKFNNFMYNLAQGLPNLEAEDRFTLADQIQEDYLRYRAADRIEAFTPEQRLNLVLPVTSGSIRVQAAIDLPGLNGGQRYELVKDIDYEDADLHKVVLNAADIQGLHRYELLRKFEGAGNLCETICKVQGSEELQSYEKLSADHVYNLLRDIQPNIDVNNEVVCKTLESLSKLEKPVLPNSEKLFTLMDKMQLKYNGDEEIFYNSLIAMSESLTTDHAFSLAHDKIKNPAYRLTLSLGINGLSADQKETLGSISGPEKFTQDDFRPGTYRD